MTITKMISVLSSIPAGAVPARKNDELFKLVVASWHEFSGSGQTSMEAWKILRDNGPEKVTWNPPLLSFVIDRHGATVLGSTRAERQQWTLNIDGRTAEHMQIGFRQLYPNAPKLNVRSLAERVCKVVQEGQSSTSDLLSDGIVVWKNADELIVFQGKLIPKTVQRTTIGRRKRFRVDLKQKMRAIGWELVSVHNWLTFKRTI